MSDMVSSTHKVIPAGPSTVHAYDVFNGDADGICALHQMRLASPREARMITGVKRDIELLRWVPCDEKADVTVLDISFDANADSLHRILDDGGSVTYFDHHSARKAFSHPRLHLHWDESPQVCTSILVDRQLQGKFRMWAVAAAYGDNLPDAARALAASIGLNHEQMCALEELGQTLNYNAYGERIEDLHIAPDELYRAVHPFSDPFDFMRASPHYREVLEGYRSDAARMDSLTPEYESDAGAIYILPCTPWARRISGVFANKLIGQGTTRSIAVLTEKTDGSYVVSVRSGQPALRGANGFCEQFPTGGGRKAAAGINSLPASALGSFAKAFAGYFAASGAVHAD